MTWNGTRWSAPDQVIPAASEYPGDGTSVSCPNAQFCMVMNSDGDYATYSGRPLRSGQSVAGPTGRPASDRPGAVAQGCSPAQLGQGGDRPPVAGGGGDPRRRSRKALLSLVSP